MVGKLNPQGDELIWSTYLGGEGIDICFGMVLDEVGNPVLVGRTWSPDFPVTTGAFDESYNGHYDVFLCKVESSGSELIWSTFLGGVESDRAKTAIFNSSGDLIVSGETKSLEFPISPGAFDEVHNGSHDFFVTKFGITTTPIYLASFSAKRLGNVVRLRWEVASNSSLFRFHVWRQEGDFIRERLTDELIDGHSTSEYLDTQPPLGAARYWLQALGFDGATTWFGPADLEPLPESNAELQLDQSRPNPFNPQTTLEFNLPRPGRAEITVYDSRGRRVAVLLDEERLQGPGEVTWGGKDQSGVFVASGVYFARLETEEGIRTQKLVLVR